MILYFVDESTTGSISLERLRADSISATDSWGDSISTEETGIASSATDNKTSIGKG